jgi:hypothetical protein
MVEIEKLIDFIKAGRKKGFRDDFIWKKLSESGYSVNDINRAFSLSGRRIQFDLRHRSKSDIDASKTIRSIVLDETLRNALEKKAAAHNLTLYNEIKKILVENADLPKLNRQEYLRLRPRHKLTREQKDRHSIANKEYQARVRKERRKVVRLRRKEERKGKKEGRRGENS